MRKHLIILFLILFMGVSFYPHKTYAAEYYSTSYKLYKQDVFGPFILSGYYTPTPNSIIFRLSKYPNFYPYSFGYRAERFWNGEFEAIEGDFSSNEKSKIYKYDGLTPNTEYSFNLRLVGLNQYNRWKYESINIDCIFNLFTEPVTPSNLTVCEINQNKITMFWDNGDNPTDTSYTVQRRVIGSDWEDILTANNLHKFTDQELSASTNYWYRVRVNCKSGRYVYSEIISAITDSDENDNPDSGFWTNQGYGFNLTLLKC